MRHLLAVLITVVTINTAFAQDGIPLRLQVIAKNERFKLVRILGTPELHGTFAATSAFSADGKRAVYVEDLTTSSDDVITFRARIVIFDTPGAGWPREIELDYGVTALELSADGKTALLAGLTGRGKEKDLAAHLSVWDLDKARQVRRVPAGERPIVALALSPDGQTTLTAFADGLKRWDLATGKAFVTYAADKLGVTALAYLPGGKRFLAGYDQGEVRLFEVDKEKPVRSFKAKREHQFIWHLAVAPDGGRFAAADNSAGAGVALWETDTGKELGTFRLEKAKADDIITSLALGRDGKTAFLTVSKPGADADDFTKVHACDLTTNKILWSAAAVYRGRVPMRIDDGNLHIGGGPNLLDVWDTATGKRLAATGGHKSPVSVVAVLPNGDVLSGGQEGIVFTWRKGKIVTRFDAHKGAVTALVINKKGDTWLTAGADSRIRHWPPDVFQAGHTGPITSLAGSTTFAASGSADRSVRTWNIASGAQVGVLTGHSEGINAVALSPDEKWLASGSDDTSIRVWPIKDGKLDADRDVIVLEQHKKPVTCVAFSADGKTLYSASQDQTIKIWDVAKGKCVRTLTGHKNWITSLTLIDDKTALTTSDDLTVCLWDLESGKELGRIDFGVVGDCPRCLARAENRILVGTSSWMIYEFEMIKSKSPGGSSSK